jgi:hypothetical protein
MVAGLRRAGNDHRPSQPLLRWSVSLNPGGWTSEPIADYGCTGTHYTEIGQLPTQQIQGGKEVQRTELIFPHQQTNGNHEIVLFPSLSSHR